MREMEIKKEWIEEASSKAEEMGNLNNSITYGKGNVSGFLGEIMTLHSLYEGEICNTYDFDILYRDKKLDVKTKRTGAVPKGYYDCSVAAYNTRQNCSHYIFTRILNDLSKGWVLGWMSKKDYFNKARLLKKGEQDGDNGFIVKAACYNLPINKLHPIEILK